MDASPEDAIIVAGRKKKNEHWWNFKEALLLFQGKPKTPLSCGLSAGVFRYLHGDFGFERSLIG